MGRSWTAQPKARAPPSAGRMRTERHTILGNGRNYSAVSFSENRKNTRTISVPVTGEHTEKSTHFVDLVTLTQTNVTLLPSTPVLPAVCSAQFAQGSSRVVSPQGVVASGRREEAAAAPPSHCKTKDIQDGIIGLGINERVTLYHVCWT